MYYIGFDIGGTKCAASVGRRTADGIEVVERKEVPTGEDPVSTLRLFSDDVTRWCKTYGAEKAGISCGGPLDAVRGVIVSTPNLHEGWHGFEIVRYVESQFPLSATLENDANASAVAEWKFGAGRGCKHMIFMTFGTGLGAGLILNGRLYSGTNGNAGEVGHIRLENDGPIGYHKAGSAEGFCSGGGIGRLAAIRAKEQGISLDSGITTKEIFEKARGGDAFCLSVVQESAEKYARVVSLLIDLFNPEVIVAGGVFMRNYDLFLPVMAPIVEREALEDARTVCRILPAEIGENIGDFAALAIAVMNDEA